MLDYALGYVHAPADADQRQHNRLAMAAMEVLSANLDVVSDFFLDCKEETKEQQLTGSGQFPKGPSEGRLSFTLQDQNPHEHSNENKRKATEKKHDLFTKDGTLTRRAICARQ